MRKLIPASLSLLAVAGFTANAAAKVDFQKEIQPIIEKSCVECHGPKKQKGKLRLDSKEAALKGGDNGKIFEAGKPEKSEIYRRITLPPGDDDIMPSKGDPLTKAQTDLIKQWILEGADWPAGALASTTAATPAGGGEVKLPEAKPGPNQAEAIQKLAAMNVAVRPIAANISLTEANIHLQAPDKADQALALLKDVNTLTDLNLANTKVTDAGLANLAGLTNLTKLHLENTQITDQGLAHLKGLNNLVYLNLFNTPVTDAGLDHLKGLTKLSRIYLWQSKVTDAGAANLQKALPNAIINTGAAVEAIIAKVEPPKPAEPEKPKPADKPKPKPVEPPKPAAPEAKPVRIVAGGPALKDADGNPWQADVGFSDGEKVDIGKVQIANTKTPDIYLTLRRGMTKFSRPVPNGNYTLRLHFAETDDLIKGPGQRVFSVMVGNETVKDIDIFKEAGGLNKALVKELPIEIKDGKLQMSFARPENAQQKQVISGIELVPRT